MQKKNIWEIKLKPSHSQNENVEYVKTIEKMQK